MSVIAKAEVTISDILDGNSISEITNFYKVSSKSSGETAPQTSGGRNLALSSKDFKESKNHWSISSFYERSVDENGYTIMHGKRSGPTEWLWNDRLIPHHYIYRQDMENGITVSFDFKCDKLEDMDQKCICALQIYNASGVRLGWFEKAYIGDEIKLKNPYIDGEWNRAYVFFNKYKLMTVFKSGCTTDDVDYASVSFQLVKNGSVYFRKVKIELGNVATDWTPAPEDLVWSTTVPTLTETNKYLWNYEMITGSDGQVISYTEPRVIGVYGDKGQTGSTGATGPTGNGIKSITEYYQISTSNTTAPTTWLTTVPTLTATNKYLWNYEKITYTNGTSVDTAKRVIGVYGDKGNTGATGPAGKGIKSTAITYQASTSGTTAPTDTWNTSVPSVPQGQYLWSRTVITYTDNSTSTTYSVAYIPKNGTDGATGSQGPTGTGIDSITQQYYLSTSKTTQTGGSWVTSMPTWSSGKYLWTRYQIDYKNPTSTAYTSPVCDSSWEAVNEIQVGGRNLIVGSSTGDPDPWYVCGWVGKSNFVSATNYSENCYLIKNGNGWVNILYDCTKQIGKTITIQAEVLLDSTHNVSDDAGLTFCIDIRTHSTNTGNRYSIKEMVIKDTDVWHKIETTHIVTDDTPYIGFYCRGKTRDSTTNQCYVYIKNVKYELGNKATDWTPAPEDMATNERVSIVEAQISVLEDSISMLVTDEDGSSLMTQTSQGWTFNISGIENRLNEAALTLNSLSGSVEQTNNLLNNLNDIINDVSKKTAYINIGADDSGNPCIELGKEDNPFKVRITNTTIDFIDNFVTVAYISNKTLYIESAVIKNQFLIGDGTGFLFKKRANGNLGLRWVG